MEEPRSQTGESEVTQRLARAGNCYHPWSGVQSKGDGAQKLPRLRVPCFLLSPNLEPVAPIGQTQTKFSDKEAWEMLPAGRWVWGRGVRGTHL